MTSCPYQPQTAVWEITVQCNMRCKHCGSSCTAQTASDELTTDEALRVADDIGRLHLRHVTLSGGEPLMRADWPLIAARLKGAGVIPNMISNGWFIDEKVIARALEVGISNIAISIDGLEKSHDFIRCPGSFVRAMAGLSLMQKCRLPSSVVTTINKRNIAELERMYALFESCGLHSWQLQIGSPMGNLAHHPDLLVEPRQVNEVIDFAHRQLGKGKLVIYLSDCVGYYTQKEQEVKAAYPSSRGGTEETCCWNGCHAGKRSFGIKTNGDVVGCTSIRDGAFIEGNVRQRSLVELWNDEKSFAWNRLFQTDRLRGFCARCGYAAVCGGGCSVTKLNFHGTLAENAYCAFSVAMGDFARNLKVASPDDMLALARVHIDRGEHQLAEAVMVKAIEHFPDQIELFALLGYIYFQLGKFNLCREAGEAALRLSPDHCYSLKGLGLALWKLGYNEEAIRRLKRACEVAPAGYLDPAHDLQVVLDATAKAPA